MRYIKTFLLEIDRWLYALVAYFPGSIGVKLRASYFKLKIQTIGERIIFGTGIEITGAENIIIGNCISVARNSSIHAHGGKVLIGDNLGMNSNSCIGAADGGEIIIGNDVMIAQNVVLRASDHAFSDTSKPICYQGHTGGRIVVGDGCWIAANSVITRNVTIGEHSIVGAGSVVTKDVEPYSIVGGVPAKLIKKRR